MKPVSAFLCLVLPACLPGAEPAQRAPVLTCRRGVRDGRTEGGFR
jgi:hypothetical protein